MRALGAPGAPVRLQTHVWNPLGGRRALLLHGLGNDGTCWWRLASQLADEGWLVLAPDLRSHGRSPTARDHAVATLAADVQLLGDGWDLVVGHSLGGAVAALALATDGFARAGVLLDPVLRLGAADHARLRAEQLAELAVQDPAAIAAAHPTWDRRDVHRKVLAAGLVTPDVVDAVFDHNDPWDLTAAAAAWPARVTLVAADPARGGLLDAATAEEVAAASRADALVWEGVGHALVREAPERLHALVREVTSTS